MADVDPANADAADAWNGADGEHWTKNAANYDRSLASYHAPLLAAAQFTPTDHVLDIGCGNGQTTRDAARAVSQGDAFAVDISGVMVARRVARLAREQGITNATFEEGDAQVYPFSPKAYDVAISRFGSMFFADPVAAFTNIAGALRHGGRLALAVWQPLDDNEWFRELTGSLAAGRTLPSPPPGAPGPFAFGDPDHVRSLLTAAGFVGIEFADHRGLMKYGADADEAYTFFSTAGFTNFLLRDLDDDARAGALATLRATLEAHATSAGVELRSAAWVITAQRS